MAVMPGTWIPVMEQLGELPLGPSMTQFTIPPGRSKILLYAWVTLHGVEDQFQRGYYRVFTRDNTGQEYSFYMNVSRVNDTISNSENFWLPCGKGFDPNLYVELHGTLITTRRKKLVRPMGCLTDVLKQHCSLGSDEYALGEVFITGYEQ